MSEDGPEKWVPEAIAEQEEHIKRYQSCRGQRFVSHRWETMTTESGVAYEACKNCQVTRTPDDYRTKLAG